MDYIYIERRSICHMWMSAKDLDEHASVMIPVMQTAKLLNT
jgi:hypothetical protein